jgi:hypothetical protein
MIMPATRTLRKAHATRQRGDPRVAFIWINDERAVAPVPEHQPGSY